MGLFDNPVKVLGDAVGAVGNVVNKVAEAAAAPLNAVVQAVTGAENDEAAARRNARNKAYNDAIDSAKAAPKNYEELAVLWNKFITSRVLTQMRVKYAELALSDVQYDKMAAIEVADYRASLSEEYYRAQLDELHQASIDAAVSQLEFERDNPDKTGTPASTNEKKEWRFENELAHWIVDRVSSNIEGASRERGDAAKVLRGVLGISVEDIQKNGILGGDNSYLRKVIPTWSDDGGVLGGENSFFRKNLGIPW